MGRLGRMPMTHARKEKQDDKKKMIIPKETKTSVPAVPEVSLHRFLKTWENRKNLIFLLTDLG